MVSNMPINDPSRVANGSRPSGSSCSIIRSMYRQTLSWSRISLPTGSPSASLARAPTSSWNETARTCPALRPLAFGGVSPSGLHVLAHLRDLHQERGRKRWILFSGGSAEPVEQDVDPARRRGAATGLHWRGDPAHHLVSLDGVVEAIGMLAGDALAGITPQRIRINWKEGAMPNNSKGSSGGVVIVLDRLSWSWAASRVVHPCLRMKTGTGRSNMTWNQGVFTVNHLDGVSATATGIPAGRASRPPSGSCPERPPEEPTRDEDLPAPPPSRCSGSWLRRTVGCVPRPQPCVRWASS